MISILDNVDLAPLTTMGLHAHCDRLITITDEAELAELSNRITAGPIFILGGGSNVVAEGDFPGTIVKFTGEKIEVLPDGRLKVQAGATLDDVIQIAAESGCVEAAALSGIPGSMGGAAVQNAGAYGSETSDFIVDVTFYDFTTGKLITRNRDELGYGYRTSLFKHQPSGKYLITSVTMDFSRGEPDKAAAAEKRETTLRQRAFKLPDVKVTGSAGSYFKNPIISEEEFGQFQQREGTENAPHFKVRCGEKLSAAWLIEQAGFKGIRRGEAGVYDKHALIIINASGNAQPSEIKNLEQEIIDGVKAKFGITLVPEVVKIGKNSKA